MVRRITLLAFAVFGLLGFFRQAWADSCASTPPLVTLTLSPDPLKLDATKSQPEIQAIGTGVAATAVDKGRNGLILGLTVSRLAVSASANTEQNTHADGTKCFSIKSVEIALGYDELTVLIPNSYSQDSCAYHQILMHEMQHVQIDRDALLDYRQRYEQAMGDVLWHLSGQPTTDFEVVGKSMNGQIRDALSSLTDTLQLELRQRNGRIDTDVEYSRVHGMCHDW